MIEIILKWWKDLFRLDGGKLLSVIYNQPIIIHYVKRDIMESDSPYALSNG